MNNVKKDCLDLNNATKSLQDFGDLLQEIVAGTELKKPDESEMQDYQQDRTKRYGKSKN